MRLMVWDRKYETRQPSMSNIFVKNIPNSYDQGKLHQTFTECGKILSCKVRLFVVLKYNYFSKMERTNQFNIFVQINQGTYKDGTKSHKFGYIQFDNEDSAAKAIAEFNGKTLNDADENEVWFVHYLFLIKVTVFTCKSLKCFEQYFLKNFTENVL